MYSPRIYKIEGRKFRKISVAFAEMGEIDLAFFYARLRNTHASDLHNALFSSSKTQDLIRIRRETNEKKEKRFITDVLMEIYASNGKYDELNKEISERESGTVNYIVLTDRIVEADGFKSAFEFIKTKDKTSKLGFLSGLPQRNHHGRHISDAGIDLMYEIYKDVGGDGDVSYPSPAAESMITIAAAHGHKELAIRVVHDLLNHIPENCRRISYHSLEKISASLLAIGEFDLALKVSEVFARVRDSQCADTRVRNRYLQLRARVFAWKGDDRESATLFGSVDGRVDRDMVEEALAGLLLATGRLDNAVWQMVKDNSDIDIIYWKISYILSKLGHPEAVRVIGEVMEDTDLKARALLLAADQSFLKGDANLGELYLKMGIDELNLKLEEETNIDDHFTGLFYDYANVAFRNGLVLEGKLILDKIISGIENYELPGSRFMASVYAVSLARKYANQNASTSISKMIFSFMSLTREKDVKTDMDIQNRLQACFLWALFEEELSKRRISTLTEQVLHRPIGMTRSILFQKFSLLASCSRSRPWR